MMRYILILFCTVMIGIQISHAQLQILTKPGKEEIKIRWVPSTPQEWDMGNRYGYKLTRVAVDKKNNVLGDSKTRILKMASQEEWEKLSESNQYARIPKGYFYDDPISPDSMSAEEIANAHAGRMIFLMLTADLSFEVAEKMGVGFRDTEVQSGLTYRYTIEINHPSQSKGKTQTHTRLGEAFFTLSPLNLKDSDFVDSTVTLSWEVNPSVQHSAYFVEKSSDDGVTFQKTEEIPYFPLSNDSDLSKINYSYKIDTLYKNYRFRVRGIDPFGDLSPASNTVEMYAFNSSITPPLDLTYTFLSQEKVLLGWQFPDSLLVNIKGFNIYRVNDTEEPIRENLKELEKDQRIFVANLKPRDESIVYKVSAIDLRGRETLSVPFTVSIIDSIAPLKVRKLEGEIDENGVVKICWEEPDDIDLFAYNIVRAEGNLTKEFFPVKQVLKGTTMVLDTIAVGRGTFPYVYYQIIPSDYNTNYTVENEWLQIIRPDVQPPLPPKFNMITYTDSTVHLSFVESFSEDVVEYRLYKSILPDTAKVLLKSINPDSLITGYIDETEEEGIKVRYVLEAIDAVGLSSKDSCNTVFMVPVPFSRPPVEDLTAKYEKNVNMVHLQWAYKTRKPVSEFWVFRKTDTMDDFKKVAVVNGKTVSWADNDTKKDIQYTYYIYGIMEDDTRTSTGKKVSIKPR